MATKNRKDVFNAWLVERAVFDGKWEIPTIPIINAIPAKLISFEEAKAVEKKSFDGWVHFYLDDYRFEALWNKPTAYLACLRKFDGVISPDFSLYRDMTLAVQLWNTYKNRAVGYWLSKNGIQVLPNVRWGDERTYEFCFSGVVPGSVVVVGTHGCIKKTEDRAYFLRGLKEMLVRLRPKTLIVYGRAPDALFSPCKEAGIPVKQFNSLFHETHHKELV